MRVFLSLLIVFGLLFVPCTSAAAADQPDGGAEPAEIDESAVIDESAHSDVVDSVEGESGSDEVPEAPEILDATPTDPEDMEDDSEASNVIYSDTLVVENLIVNSIEPMSIPEDNVYPAAAPFSGGLYIEANTSQLGRVYIYVPVDYQRGSLAFDSSGAIVNIRSATITGYMVRASNNAQYNIRWTSFGTAEYRTFNTGTYAALDITSIYNTNVVFVEHTSDLPVVPLSETYQLIEIFLLGVIALCLFMRRL